MNLGSNIHAAFSVVFETFKSIDKLMIKCKAELDETKYYMPVDRFMRYSSDTSWEGWIYWSFIMLYQRCEDGKVMENGWIDGPVYAVEINVDSDTCEEPKLYIAKMQFEDIASWSKGCSPANHTLFYNAIHGVGWYEIKEKNEFTYSLPKTGYEQKVKQNFWGFRKLIRTSSNLVEVTPNNYRECIFGQIDKLSRVANNIKP